MAALTMNVKWHKRPALYTPSPHNAKKYNLDGITRCDVLGIFQIEESEYQDAMFVVELPDGRCCYAGVEAIQFLPEESEGR